MNDEHEVESALRASLAAHARHAPAGADLAERIITEAEELPTVRHVRHHGRSRWHTWTMPLVAAGAVAAVAATIVGVNAIHHDADHGAPAGTHRTPTQPAPYSSPAPLTGTSHASSLPPSTANGGGGAGSADLTDLQVKDVTFGGADEGWALATATCLPPAKGTCSAMVRTTDGSTWTSMPNPPGNVPGVSAGCATDCVRHIRFANAQTGYAYGPDYGQMTTDGGATWTSIGGADALETLDGNVIRVSHPSGSCPPGCTYTVQVAAVGSTTWHTVAIPGKHLGDSVQLVRSGRDAYLEIYQNPAGGAGLATATLLESTDDGTTWTDQGEPCPQTGGEADSTMLATAADGSGSLAVVCVPRGTTTPFTITSPGAGKPFTAGKPGGLGSVDVTLVAAASARVLFVMTDALYRSTDGGRTWRRVQQNSAGPLGATWIGFESATDGRVVETNYSGRPGSTLWTTHDAGTSWAAHVFR